MQRCRTALFIGVSVLVATLFGVLSFAQIGPSPSFAGTVTSSPMVLKYDVISNETITVPIYGHVDLVVDWGDGSPQESIDAGELPAHDYPKERSYTVTLTATSATSFGNCSVLSQSRLLEVISFGEMGMTSFYEGFCNATSLTAVPATLPGSITSVSSMFKGASALNDDISTWNVANVTDMSGLFYGASNFNQPLNSWNVANVTNMSHMFLGATVFNQDLNSWNVANVTNMRHMFNEASAFNGNISSWKTGLVEDMAHMFEYATVFNKDISGWNTSSVTTLFRTFGSASALNQPIGSWDVRNVTDFRETFREAIAFNQPLNNWVTSSATDMELMFYGATAFNQALDKWDVSQVTNFVQMFRGATNFNGNITTWKTGNVTNMFGMFADTSAFNQNISSWNTSKVTNMGSMFFNASAFNQPLGSWNTAQVNDMSDMFAHAQSFNSSLAGWNTSQVNTMSRMFLAATAFNQPIGSWDVSAVTDMSYMFTNATNFNQPLTNWQPLSLETASWMFADAPAYNQPMPWNLPKLIDADFMFINAFAFNQDMSEFRAPSLQNAGFMFYATHALDQSFASWNMSAVTNVSSMFDWSGMSVDNYDALLNSWANQDVVNDLTFGVWNLFYSNAGAAARDRLITEQGWAFSGDAPAETATVLSEPTVMPQPAGTPLTDDLLVGGSASVPGAFSFVNQNARLVAGTHQVSVRFVPEDTHLYASVPLSITVQITPVHVEPEAQAQYMNLSTTGSHMPDNSLTALFLTLLGIALMRTRRYTLSVISRSTLKKPGAT